MKLEIANAPKFLNKFFKNATMLTGMTMDIMHITYFGKRAKDLPLHQFNDGLGQEWSDIVTYVFCKDETEIKMIGWKPCEKTGPITRCRP